MAYGSPRRRREHDPDLRDVVEDAAREAGMSVSAFLDSAVSAHEVESNRRRGTERRPLRVVDDEYSPLEGLERRLTRNARQQDEMSEDRVVRILGRAFDEIRASEERTAALIEAMAQPAPANQTGASHRHADVPARPDRTQPATVADILASAERRSQSARNVVDFQLAQRQVAPPPVGSARRTDDFDSAMASAGHVVSRLQADVMRVEMENALILLERKLKLVQPQTSHDQVMLQGMAAEIATIRALVLAEGAAIPFAAIEAPIAALTRRIAALAAAPQPSEPSPDLRDLDRKLDLVSHSTTAMIGGIQDELVRLGQSGINRNEQQLAASFNRLDGRIAQLEQISREPLEQIRRQLEQVGRAASDNGQTEALRGSIAQLEAKLEQLTTRISQPLQMVHNAVSLLSRQHTAQQQAGDPRLDQLFGELAELKRGLNNPSAPQMQQQLADISERIETMALRMQQSQSPPPRDLRRKPIDEEIAELKRLITAAKSPCDDTKVLEAIAHLERKIAMLENSPQVLLERLDRLQAKIESAPTGASAAPLPGNIEVLLRNLAMRLETSQIGSPVDDAALDRLHGEIRQLSRKLEEAPAAAGMMPAMQDISALERGMSDLFRQIDGIKLEVGDTAARAAVDAIRQMQPLPQAPLPPAAPIKADTTVLETSLGQLRQQQADAEQRTARTLEALHDTLHRVVDRLASMEHAPPPAPQAVAQAAPNPAVVAAPALMAQPAVTDWAAAFSPAITSSTPPAPGAVWQQGPVIAPQPMAAPVVPNPARPAAQDGINLLPNDILMPESAASARRAPDVPIAPAAADSQKPFAETLAALRAARPTEPVAQNARPDSKSALSSAFSAARNAMASLKGGKGEATAPVIPEAAAMPSPAAAPAETARTDAPRAAPMSDLDVPLAPSSTRPRAGAPRPATTGGHASVSPSSDPKAEFLAAARRAAQAAAQQSAEVLSDADPKARRKAQAAQAAADRAAQNRAPQDMVAAAADGAGNGSGFRAKHAMLLGLAALIVAAGAGYQFMAAPKRAEAPQVQPSPRTSSLTPEQLALPEQYAAIPPRRLDGPAPRQILPPAIVAEMPRPPERVAAAPAVPAPAQAAAVSDEPVAVGSIPTPSRVPSSSLPPLSPDDPLLKFEGLRDASRLREAARRGDSAAFVELGMRYAEGRGAVRDPKTAALWFERAADFGSAPAQYRLGTLHREGRGVERNAKTALKHFTTAAEAGNARAMHNTAVLLAEGVNGAPDYAGAGEWFKKAAEFGIRDSQFNLAILYARGLGVGQDLMASYAWFAAAAANGDEDAAKKRDEVGSRLSPERLQQARAASAQWKAKVPDPLANEVIAPAGGWDAEAKSAPAGANPPKATPKRS